MLVGYHKIKDNIVYLKAPGSFLCYYIDIVMCFIEITLFSRLQLLSVYLYSTGFGSIFLS
jgi:hypothetical protein